MDPSTGEFHPVDYKDGQMVVKETQEPVPQHWPIFTLGETYVIEGHEFKLRKVSNGKDLMFRPVVGKPDKYFNRT